MLKALELTGFKSFADRTRFEFPPGITVVVGPNGSGKSNIVDAIKWVLGEQSVKSLRGREMADVIFNGSGGRRATNSAEITLTLDNSKHLLAIDTPEVYITRRVYRSGEGEYLINRNPARLRDIRDLLSGTGMGTQAYSVIEQGKVDVLLQSSARDRRAIFEEAAGISRFKVRKIEALRRLERVEQNLLRLSDIVDEVENQLRSIRTQAGKARRYKEHTNRLQELRTQVGLVDWRRLSERIAEFEGEMQSFGDERNAAIAEAERFEAQRIETENAVNEINEGIRQAESQIAANRERIASAESTIEHERSRGADLEQEIARYRRQLVALGTRAGDLQQQLQDTAEAIQTATENHRGIAKQLVEAERNLTEIIAELDHLRGENQQRRGTHLQQMRQAAALGNETSALESRVASADATRERSAGRIEELDRALDVLHRQLEDFSSRREQLARQTDEQTQRMLCAKERLVQDQQQHAADLKQLSEMRQRHSGAVERAAVLEELVRRHEGLSAGVKEVLESVGKGDSPIFADHRCATVPAKIGTVPDAKVPVFRSVCGLAADLFHVSVEAAPLVEIALGPAAQHIVASQTPELLDYLQAQAGKLSGRVGFLWLDSLSTTAARGFALKNEPPVDLEGIPGVLGRGDRFIETQPRFLPLAERLLGRTWFVEKLSHALALSRSQGRGLRFVTLSGELLDSDGTLIVGPRNISTGVISRRSQLRALQTQIAESLSAIDAAVRSNAELAEKIADGQDRLDRHTVEFQQAAAALAENRVAIAAAEERRVQLDQQRAALESERLAADRQHAEALRLFDDAQEKRKQIDAVLGEMEAELARLAQQIERREADRVASGRETTEIKVELAKCEERLRNLQARMRQFEESRQERHRAIDEARERLADCRHRVEASQWNILRAESEIADLYLRKESFALQTIDLVNRREAFQEQRAALISEIQKIQGRIRKLEERLHAADLAANEVRHERNALADRMREDYGIELSALEHEPSGEEQRQREEVQQETEELRQKINNLGSVNLEALAELESLETRHKTLFDQHADLSSAKASLEKIIDRINADSRRLFSETFETVKGHFQTLFRDLFGGGQADILLEENVDILDSGIEIIARPPGKEPRSISLLSGGEKTLTCVALLLAIFRSRPSPFCVLDEVDAALDEANIDRFTQVLQGFLTWTQFIIVTHSKKTMTSANTIYGVTMQESGISKQVSVRFEDVSDDGEILTDRAAEEAA